MSLTNIDKDTNDRVNPSVNSPDVQLNPMAHATASISPRAPGSVAGKVVTKDSKIIANDGTNNVGLFGFDDVGNMVLKVAKPGFDANNATASQLIFNSAQDVFKIALTDTATIPALTTGHKASVTVTHDLGFAPTVLASIANGFPGLQPLPIISFDVSSGLIQWQMDIEDITTTTFDLVVYATSGFIPFTATDIKWYALQETAN